MNNSEILLYQNKDGQTKIDVRLEDESKVWSYWQENSQYITYHKPLHHTLKK